MCLLAEVPLAGVLLHEVLLVAEEKVSTVSELLEKREKIPLELEIVGEEKALLLLWRFACDLVFLVPLLFG